MNDCVDLMAEEMSQLGLLELSESQGVFEEDERDGAPASQKDSQKPASQCMFTFCCNHLICCRLVNFFLMGFF